MAHNFFWDTVHSLNITLVVIKHMNLLYLFTHKQDLVRNRRETNIEDYPEAHLPETVW